MITKTFRLSQRLMLAMYVIPICCAFILASAVLTATHGDETGDSPRKIPIMLGEKTIQAVLADTRQACIEGLLGWETITYDSGMLLDFKVEGEYAIHMQGMRFPIDAVWIDADNVIQLIYPSIQPDSGRVYPSIVPCRYCLELKAGFCERYGVKMGKKVRFGPR